MLRMRGLVLLMLISTSVYGQQNIFWRRDHIYNGPGGNEIAVIPRAE